MCLFGVKTIDDAVESGAGGRPNSPGYNLIEPPCTNCVAHAQQVSLGNNEWILRLRAIVEPQDNIEILSHGRFATHGEAYAIGARVFKWQTVCCREA